MGDFVAIPNTNGQKRFWTAKEAAAYISVSVWTLYAMCRYKPNRKAHLRIDTPPYRRMGRNILRFPIEEFTEWASRFDVPSQER